MKNDLTVQRIIITRVSEHVLSALVQCPTAAGMFTKLETLFYQESKIYLNVFQQKYFSFDYKNNGSMSSSITRMEKLVKVMESLGETLPESMVVTKVLRLLLNEYNY